MKRPGGRWDDGGAAFNRWSGDRVRLQFCCPKHGLFPDVVFSSRVAAAPGPPGLTHACQTPVDPRLALAGLPSICCRVSPWVRSTEDDDPGDEGR